MVRTKQQSTNYYAILEPVIAMNETRFKFVHLVLYQEQVSVDHRNLRVTYFAAFIFDRR